MTRIIDVSKRILSTSIYLEDHAFQFARFKKNSWVRQQINELSKIDPLRDFDEFRREVIKLKTSRKFDSGMFELAGIGSESRYYGHLRALAEFAEVPYKDDLRFQMPYIEHGIRFQEDISPTLKSKSTHCVISQGNNLRKSVSSVLPGIPQFGIGPYIHYAKPSLTEDEIASYKKSLGKCLLIFPSHSMETEAADFDEVRFAAAIESFAGEGFDNVLCCFYWHDVDSPFVERVKSMGAIPVSAGMRGDCNFIRRLRSVIQCASAAAGNALGTHIGYCLHLEVPYRWLNVEVTASGNGGGRFRAVENSFMRAFEDWSTLDDPRARFNFERYWGGRDLLLSKEELKGVFEITQDALLLSHGWSSKFPPIYQQLLDLYQADSSKTSEIKHSILLKALEE